MKFGAEQPQVPYFWGLGTVKGKSTFFENKVGANSEFFLEEKSMLIILAPLGAGDDQTCE